MLDNYTRRDLRDGYKAVGSLLGSGHANARAWQTHRVWLTQANKGNSASKARSRLRILALHFLSQRVERDELISLLSAQRSQQWSLRPAVSIERAARA